MTGRSSSRPDELFDLLRQAGLEPVDRKGFVFNPISWTWSLSDRDLSVNYVTASRKRGLGVRFQPGAQAAQHRQRRAHLVLAQFARRPLKSAA